MKILLARCYTARSSKETLVGSLVRTVNVQACVPYHHAGSLKQFPVGTCRTSGRKCFPAPSRNLPRWVCRRSTWTGACYDRPEGAFKKHRLTCTLFVGLPRFELGTFGPPDRCGTLEKRPPPKWGPSLGAQTARTLRASGPLRPGPTSNSTV